MDSGDDDGLGVRYLDHTADVGLGLHAWDLGGLFTNAARGLMGLVLGGDAAAEVESELEGPESEERIACSAKDVESLFVEWLRELVWLVSTRPVAITGVDFETISETGLDAHLRIRSTSKPPIREIKGVTWHDLHVRREGPGWTAQVIFDV